MKNKFITFLFVIFATIILAELSGKAQAQNPQSCYYGYKNWESKNYDKSVAELSTCLRSSQLTTEFRATYYYYRGVSYFYLYEEEEYVKKNPKKAYKLLFKAYDDIEKSIELNPTGNAKAYCVRGWIDFEGTYGLDGYEDMDKGVAMGAPRDFCYG